MSAIATPLFAGDLHDSALRLAQAQRAGSRTTGADLQAAWRQMLDLGWQAVLVAEEHGGAGADLADFAAIVEALATQAVTVPLIDRCAVAPSLLAATAAHPQARVLLEKVAAGERSVAAALQTASQHAGAAPSLGNDGRLTGGPLTVDWSVPATDLVFDARGAEDGAPVLVLVEAAALQTRMRRFVGLDGALTATVDVDGLLVTREQRLAQGEAAATAVDRAQQLGSLLGCVRTIGACGAITEQTIEYLNTRVQFGAALSSFQALRHRAVDMYVAYENARGLVRDRVLEHTRNPDARQVALTRLYVQGVGRTIGESAIQLHGGMGMSQETPAARLSMHTMMSGLQYGGKPDCLDWLTARMAGEAQAA
jgi:alkylation response protein AidB-like acyl-CoA dehydrogenase